MLLLLLFFGCFLFWPVWGVGWAVVCLVVIFTQRVASNKQIYNMRDNHRLFYSTIPQCIRDQNASSVAVLLLLFFNMKILLFFSFSFLHFILLLLFSPE